MNLTILVVLFASVIAKHEIYIGWKAYNVNASTEEQVNKLNSLGAKLCLDFLSPLILKRKAVVLVPPKHQRVFLKKLGDLGIKYKTHAGDVKRILDHDDELIQNWTKSFVRKGGISMPYNNYQQLDVIYAYMDTIAYKFHETATLMTAGYSFQGRPIKYMKISSTNFEDDTKPIIYIDAAIHAREWISTPVVTWAIKKLTEDLTDSYLIHNYDWILMPVVNPDGYEYTFKRDRFWRKTRSTNTHSRSNVCPGVDGNRNFDYFWNTTGTSGNPCSGVYSGNHAFSELESRAVRDLLQEHRTRIALYLSLHSFGSMILYPWAYDGSPSYNSFNLHTVGVDMTTAIIFYSAPNFPGYIVGNSAWVINYNSSGSSSDYAHSIGIPLTYTIELPGLLDNLNGFSLEPKYIEQVCSETWGSIVVGAKSAKQLFINRLLN